jgi:hypothetical protein
MTMSRLKLMADRNGISVRDAAINIVATALGKIDQRHPREDDNITVKITRTPPKTALKFAPRTSPPQPPKPFVTRKKKDDGSDSD